MARILWVSSETPDREGQGGQRRQFHQIRALDAAGHEITVLTLAGEQRGRSVAEHAKLVHRRISVLGRPLRLLERRLHSYVSSARCDAVVLSHPQSAWMLSDPAPAPVLLDVHNVFSHWHATWGRADEARAAWEEERAAIARASAVMVCSATELGRLNARHPDTIGRSFAAPMGVDPREWPDRGFDRSQPLVELFGSWSWAPNREGLDWFARQVWPRVLALAPDARAEVAGGGAETSGWPAGMRSLGRVADLAAFTSRAAVVATPVMQGVGAAVKFAEALATGAAVAATPDAANGFAETPAFVSADPDEWARWIADRLAARANEPAPHRGRAFALSELTWANAVHPIEDWLASLA